jgi:hypothetical protein
MIKSNLFATALVAMTLASVSLEGHASSTYVFGGTGVANVAQANVSGGTDPAMNGLSTQYAVNGGSYTNSTTYNINDFANGAKWTAGTASYYSGGGLGNTSDGNVEPNHAIDNGPSRNSSNVINGIGNTESVLLSFSSSVVLTSIGLGYINTDADISLFRYTGAGNPPSITATGASLTAMSAAGWSLVGNYADLGVDTSSPSYNAVNTGNLGSSWWLISAYNTSYGNTSSNGGVLTQGNDYFKLYAVAATTCTNTSTPGACGGVPGKVPEPGSLALVALGFLAMVPQLRRRAQKLN